MKPYQQTKLINSHQQQIKMNIFRYFPKDHQICVHPHWHTEMEIIYIISGDVDIQINDNRFLASTSDLIIISSGDIHATYAKQKKDDEILVFHLNTDFINSDFFDLQEKKILNSFNENILFPNIICHTDSNYMILKNIIFDIYEEWNNKKDTSSIIIKSNILKLIGMLMKSYSNNIKTSNNKEIFKAKSMLENTFTLINNHYMENITLDTAAKASNLSIPHFCRLFKKATGTTFNSYLAFYRISQSEKMLNSQKSLYAICDQCGFGSMNNFIRTFKKYKKCTPSFYKKESEE